MTKNLFFLLQVMRVEEYPLMSRSVPRKLFAYMITRSQRIDKTRTNKMRIARIAALLVLAASLGSTSTGSISDSSDRSPIVKAEFIFEEAPFPSCHASTIAETRNGLVAAWFGGTREKNPDVGIWLSRYEKSSWTKPVEVANGVQDSGTRNPCWNPVLFQPKSGPLMLFFKVGPSPSEWWGMLMTSADGGVTWSKALRLPDAILGPIKNKPIQLGDGSLLCPSSSENAGWQVHMEYSSDLGATWRKSDSLNDKAQFSSIQPTILVHGTRLQILCRSRQKRITECWSNDSGKTWTSMKATSLPNPNSGIDAVSLKDGRSLLVYNHTERDRSPLNVAISFDGSAWKAGVVLEDQPGEYSYPAVIQTKDGMVHITYTWKRQRIKHVVLDPRQLVLKDIIDGHWPE